MVERSVPPPRTTPFTVLMVQHLHCNCQAMTSPRVRASGKALPTFHPPNQNSERSQPSAVHRLLSSIVTTVGLQKTAIHTTLDYPETPQSLVQSSGARPARVNHRSRKMFVVHKCFSKTLPLTLLLEQSSNPQSPTPVPNTARCLPQIPATSSAL